ncbi:Golgi apyrase [Chytridiales sp. JEL 0842]|nr:Golgi apyrase [Chytridiales sp. JEL 0842]
MLRTSSGNNLASRDSSPAANVTPLRSSSSIRDPPSDSSNTKFPSLLKNVLNKPENHGVFFQHAWVTLNYWLCGAKVIDKYFVTALASLLIIFFVASMFLIKNAVPAAAPSRPSKPNVTYQSIDEAILNLDPIPMLTPSLQPSSESNRDSWSSNRNYGIVIDAGSSGSRILVYSWKDISIQRETGIVQLPTIDKADRDGKEWHKSIEPGLSSLASNPLETGEYLKPLLDYALSTIPAHKIESTPIYLLATAGMRLIDATARDVILNEACRTVRRHYSFSTSGGCDRHFRVISGELEGIYGWLTANYLMDGFAESQSLGFLDMGGASTQIAFEPPKEQKDLGRPEDLTLVKLRTVFGKDLNFGVFSTTFLGFGMNEARRSASTSGSELMTETPESSTSSNSSNTQDKTIEFENSIQENQISNSTDIVDPCLLQGASLPEPKLKPISPTDAPNTHTLLKGTGSFNKCINQLRPLLNKTAYCELDPCLFNGVHAPLPNLSTPKPKSKSPLSFIGVSEYFYTSDSIFGLSGAYNPSKFIKAAQTYCSTPWMDALSKLKDGIWTQVDEKRVAMQCFKSAWVVTVLHYGLGIPVPNETEEEDEEGEEYPVLRTVNEAKGFPMSWTLGAMLLHVAATIPPSREVADGGFGGYGWEETFAFWALLGIVVGLMGSMAFMSTLREVPDNQEVWVDTETNQSVIIEILEMVPEASDPGSLDTTIHLVVGRQAIAKFRSNEPNSPRDHVNIYMAVIRIPRVATDLLISYNDPAMVATELESGIGGGGEKGLEYFMEIARSLEIKDWGLFA